MHVLYCIAILTAVLPFHLRTAVHYTSPKCPLCERRPAHYATCTLEVGLFIVHRLPNLFLNMLFCKEDWFRCNRVKERVSMRRAKRTAALELAICSVYQVRICEIYCQKHTRIMFKLLMLQFISKEIYFPRDALLSCLLPNLLFYLGETVECVSRATYFICMGITVWIF